MQKLHFSISELCIVSGPIQQTIANKILEHHIWPMNPVREKLGHPITASQNSGFRPTYYEKTRGRSGTSEHCFIGKGAVDWTTTTGSIKTLLYLIMKHTNYTRVCYYPNDHFIHCDYARPEEGRRYFECASPVSAWKFIKSI